MLTDEQLKQVEKRLLAAINAAPNPTELAALTQALVSLQSMQVADQMMEQQERAWQESHGEELAPGVYLTPFSNEFTPKE